MPSHNAESALGALRRARAFTLVEILCVVVILGIIAAVVGISLGTRDDLKAKSAARVLSANLQYIQSRAVVRRQRHYVTIGNAGDSIRFAIRSGGLWQSLTHPVDQNEFRMVFGPAGSGGGKDIRLVTEDFNGNNVFGFDETGTPFFCDGDGNNVIEASVPATFRLAAGDYEIVITVQPITGEVSISE